MKGLLVLGLGARIGPGHVAAVQWRVGVVMDAHVIAWRPACLAKHMHVYICKHAHPYTYRRLLALHKRAAK